MDDQRGREHQIRVDFQLVSTNPTYIKKTKKWESLQVCLEPLSSLKSDNYSLFRAKSFQGVLIHFSLLL